jgi:hypothetical protein
MGTTQSMNNVPNASSGGSGSREEGFDNIYAQNSSSRNNFSSNYNLQAAASNADLDSSRPKNGLTTDPIPPELLIAEINGEIAENDYFARSVKVLQNIQIDNIDIYKPEDAIDLDDAYLLAEPGYLAMENGIVRKPDGSLYIAIFVDLGYEVNGDMFDWWFCNCDNNEKFRWWHPVNHVSGTWDPAFYSMMNFERQPGHYIDHIHITQQYIPSSSSSSRNSTANVNINENNTNNANNNNPNPLHKEDDSSSKNMYSIQIEYIRPSKFFDTAKFEENNITCCIIGKINLKDSFFQTYIHFGYVFYIIREINGRSELRIRYFLGDSFFYYLENMDNYYYSQLVYYLTNNYLFRCFKLPISLGKNIYQNCLEEMLCLREILPHYYRQTQQAQREFQLNYSFTS